MGTERLSRRQRRALGSIGLAIVVIAVAAFAFLHSTVRSTTKSPLQSINPRLVTSNPVRYDFVTPTLGWAVEYGVTPATTTGQFRVFKTTDGAQHWEAQLTGQGSGPGFISIEVQFLDRMHGFMTVGVPSYGEQFYRTNDGGAHWQPVALPAPLIVVVTFSDANHGWALAQPSSGSASTTGQLFKLYATRDRGLTWQALPDPPADAYYLAYRGPTEAWMGSLGPSLPHVYTSTDGGHSWQRHDLNPPPGRTWNTSGSGSSVQLLPVAGAVASTEGTDLFTSFDAGTTWRYVPAPPGQVAYQDAFHWWAINSPALYKSSDAGQTWTQVTDALPHWEFVPHVIDSKHAWAELTVVGGYALALTDDGGLHWTQASVPPTG